MRKILFIIQSYPSERSANVLCDEKIMKLLVQEGKYEIHCLVYRYADQPMEEYVDGVFVHRWNRGLWWRLYSTAEYREAEKGIIIKWLNRVWMRVKQFVFIPLFPFYEPLLARKFARQAFKLNKECCFDMVFAEYNGLDTLYAGWKLKRRVKDILFVPAFWDSLSGGFRPKYLPKVFVDKRKKLLEVKILNECNLAFAMESHKKHLAELYKDRVEIFRKICFLDIPYLSIQFETDDLSTDLVSHRITMVFSGNMSMRDPKNLFEVIAASSKRGEICIEFYTNKRYHNRIEACAKTASLAIGQDVVLHDYIPHKELEAVMRRANILLNFGVDNPNAISGKVFEYIGYRKPIISTYRIDDEAVISVLNKYPIALLLDERLPVDVQARTLDLFIEQHVGHLACVKQIQTTYWRNMPQTYINAINELFEKER